MTNHGQPAPRPLLVFSQAPAADVRALLPLGWEANAINLIQVIRGHGSIWNAHAALVGAAPLARELVTGLANVRPGLAILAFSDEQDEAERLLEAGAAAVLPCAAPPSLVAVQLETVCGEPAAPATGVPSTV